VQQQQYVSKDQAVQKLRHFCAYQERCHQEVKDKLYSYGLHKLEVEELISQLIEENYLNEERFAIQFAGGKFRMKHWGRVKIKHELKSKLVSEYCIKQALKQINEEDYSKTLEKLAEDKWRSLRTEKQLLKKKKKLYAYLIQKGYETSLVSELIQNFK
jgi:regulatory protein